MPEELPTMYYQPSKFNPNFQKFIKNDLLSFQPDVIFVPTARRFKFGDVPVVNMIRNMEPLAVPYGENPLIEKVKNFFRAREARMVTKKAHRIIAVSEHVKDFLTHEWEISSEKIGIVYHGINNQDLNQRTIQKPLNVTINNRFLFTAGSIRPARGLEDLIKAIPHIISTFPDLSVLIAGKVDPGMETYYNSLLKLSESLSVQNIILWIGQLPSHEMEWCFRNCSAFVMTSRAEACPNTVLESMSFGSVSISTDTDPMPEFYKNNAFYYNSGHHESLSKAIFKVLNMSESQLQKYSEKAVDQAKLFSWKICAENTVLELQKAISKTDYIRLID
ncbi:MAG: glycosyltransferase [Balneolaceae bacterium]|nr:MAG: glycosyltransferase [Balneolaceae bacterium]